MYAEDSIGNLAQLYVSSPYALTLLWNHADGIRQLSVETNGLGERVKLNQIGLYLPFSNLFSWVSLLN